MQQITDIIQFSKDNKTALQNFGRWNFESGYLPEYQKHQRNALFLLSLENPTELCRFLRTPIHQLEEIINTPGYKHFVIKKKRGGERHIFAPEKRLKQIQRRINYYNERPDNGDLSQIRALRLA
jgi:hypothetical protein